MANKAVEISAHVNGAITKMNKGSTSKMMERTHNKLPDLHKLIKEKFIHARMKLVAAKDGLIMLSELDLAKQVEVEAKLEEMSGIIAKKLEIPKTICALFVLAETE